MANYHTKVLILGSGPAGCAAAIYAARANLKPVLVAGMQLGGQLTITTDVENYPGFAAPIQGPQLMEQMIAQAQYVGAILVEDTVMEVDLQKRPFTATGDSGDLYYGETLILCTGASAKWLGLESEKRYQGFGVSACATCDGFFFLDKEVCVVGGGNAAVEEALYLTNHATRVTIIHRRNAFRAERVTQDRLFANPKIHVLWDTVIEEVLGEQTPPSVTGVKVRNVKTSMIYTVNCDGLFIAIGHTPNTELFKGKLLLDEDGYIVTAPNSTATSVAGVLAAGDVQDHIYRQAVTAAGTGCMAALEADRFLAAHGIMAGSGSG
ncbi:Thioredoxin reductase [invertebrate metagenome]|uniref:Thioredoxin reductase n=1 Tax=invertebrate metagenome TaxID=1711999 RepID=A0A484HAX2_9ZZZZ